ncbi:hypothetical protein JXB12_01870 [candidate division KSB1 bacterium]|nr:hypothetical protein [candidate division KSB1 bacterium]
MRFKSLLLTTTSVVMLLWNTNSNAQSTSKIDGVAFADYYYNIKNNVSVEKDRNAFALRRFYFTFENNISSDLKVRFRLESEHDKYGTSAKINPFVKHAYLEWSNLIPRHKLYLGIAETNAFKNSEEYWGYRSIEKTIMDLNKISSSADMGVAIKGDLMGDLVHHWLTVFNGTGYGSAEVDRFKKFGYALWITPAEGLILEGYVDYENQDPTGAQTASNLSSARDYIAAEGYKTMKGFIGYSTSLFTVGTEAFWRTNEKSGVKNVSMVHDDNTGDYSITSSTSADVKRFGYSAFGSVMTPISNLKVFARYDFFDQNTDDKVFTKFDKTTGALSGGNDDEFTQIFFGFDYVPQKNLHIMPNFILKSYTKDGKDSDLMGRITMYFKFNSGKIISE